MASGSWGLKAFVLGERGYIYNEPDWGTGDPAVVLPILAAWDPVCDSFTFRASFLYTYKKCCNRIGLPPCMGQWAKGPFDLMVEAISSVLRWNRESWSKVLTRVQKRYDSRKGQPMSFDAFSSEVQSRTGIPIATVCSILQPVWESTEPDPVLDHKVSDKECRVLVAAFLVRIGERSLPRQSA
jgi:hypothetical protein